MDQTLNRSSLICERIKFYNKGPLKEDARRVPSLRAEVIKSPKLQHLRRPYKHDAFQKVKHKLDLIEQSYLDEIYSH